MDERRGTTERRMGILDRLAEFWEDCQQLYRSLTFARDQPLDRSTYDALLNAVRVLTEKAISMVKLAISETKGTTCESFPKELQKIIAYFIKLVRENLKVGNVINDFILHDLKSCLTERVAPVVRNLTAVLENLYRRSVMLNPVADVEEKARIAALRVLALVDIIKSMDQERFRVESGLAAHELSAVIDEAKRLGLNEERMKLHSASHQFLVLTRDAIGGKRTSSAVMEKSAEVAAAIREFIVTYRALQPPESAPSSRPQSQTELPAPWRKGSLKDLLGNEEIFKFTFPADTVFAEYITPLQLRAESLSEDPISIASTPSEVSTEDIRGPDYKDSTPTKKEKPKKRKDTKHKKEKEKDTKDKKDKKKENDKSKDKQEKEKEKSDKSENEDITGATILTESGQQWQPSKKAKKKVQLLLADDREKEISPSAILALGGSVIGGSKIREQEKIRLEKRNQIYLLEVHILSAEDLPCVDKNATTNPYCVATLAGRQQSTTKLKKTRAPEWNQTLAFKVVKNYSWKEAKLKLELYHSTLLGKDLPLGEIEVVLEDLDFEKQSRYSFRNQKIDHRDVVTQGFINFDVSFGPKQKFGSIKTKTSKEFYRTPRAQAVGAEGQPEENKNKKVFDTL